VKLSEFDRDVLNVAIKAFREHDPSLSENDAKAVFLQDWPVIVQGAGGKPIRMLELRIRLLRGRLPTDRGRVAGKPFWLRRDVVRWAESTRT